MTDAIRSNAPGPRAPGSGAPCILLIQQRFMGDVLLCTPAVRAVRRAFPAARLDFLAEPAGAEAIRGNPHLDEVVVWPRDRSPLAMGVSLRGRGYDVVLDFRSSPSTAQVTRLTGARRRVGVRGRGPRNLLYTELVSEGDDSTYMARKKLALLAPLGIEPASVTDLSLEIAVGEAERRRAEEVWEAHGLRPDRPVVAVSAVSRERYKQWGTERWARVVRRLAEGGAQVLVTSGPGEREQAAAVAGDAPPGVVWDYGPTTVRELAALYERCALWAGNDGGPKHVAVAAGVPTVTVVRWTLGPLWTPPADPDLHRFLDRVPPQGCDRNCGRCPHLGCLEAVAEDELVAEIEARLRVGGRR